jgi:hypothetical protein
MLARYGPLSVEVFAGLNLPPQKGPVLGRRPEIVFQKLRCFIGEAVRILPLVRFGNLHDHDEGQRGPAWQIHPDHELRIINPLAIRAEIELIVHLDNGG